MTKYLEHGSPDGNLPCPASQLKWLLGASLLATLTLGGSALAEDNRLLRFPSLFKKAEVPVVQPQAKKEATDDRVLNRARQLMADARKEEGQGRIDIALDLAARADGVYRAAQRTTDARWPANEQSPAEYVRQLESKLIQRGSPTSTGSPAAVSVGVLPGQPKVASRASNVANAVTNSLTTSGDFGKAQRPIEEEEVSAAAEQLTSQILPSPTKVFEGLSKRGHQLLDVADAVREVADAATEPDQADQSNPNGPLSTEPTKNERSLQTARNVLDRLDQMQTWQPVAGEKPKSDGHEPPLPHDAGTSGTSKSPLLIGTPSGIEDDQVNPIPTFLQDEVPTHSGPSPIEIGHPEHSRTPGQLSHDLPSNPIGSQATTASGRPDPWLMPPVGAASRDDESRSDKTQSASLWVIGSVQAISTFIGALGALLVVLALRPKANAVQQQVAPAKPIAESLIAAVPSVPVAVEPASTESISVVHEPTTIPFRRLDVAADRESTKPTLPMTHEAAAKSVFEQNLQLLDELNHLSEKKAA